MSKYRVFGLLCILGLMAVVAAGAWFAGRQIVSPAEAAARTSPPAPSLILVPVEKRVLSSRIVVRGTARFGTPQAIALAPSALKANSAALLTTLPLPNAQFKEGDVVFTASGRPVMVLQGTSPAYRDLAPGVTGNDVRQLEEALKRLGYEPGTADGNFDEKTSAAVAHWYQSKGYEPFGPTPDQLAKARALETAMADAVKAKLSAATVAATADLAVKNARLKAELAKQTAEADVAARIADRELIALDPKSLRTARVAAEAKVNIARSSVDSAKVDGDAAVRGALEAQKLAAFDARLTSEREAQATAEWRKAMQAMGVSVPLDEIVFLPTLPVRVEQVTGVVGGAANGPILSVTDNQIVIDSALPLEVAPLVKPGMEVAIDEPALGIKTTGNVEKVAETPGTHGVDGYHFYFSVRVGETTMPLHGFSLRLTMPIKSTSGAVLAVPTSALTLAADGKSRVQVQKNGKLEFVQVEPGLAADGYVEVKLIQGSLEPGQLVVVGTEQVASSEAPTKQP